MNINKTLKIIALLSVIFTITSCSKISSIVNITTTEQIQPQNEFADVENNLIYKLSDDKTHYIVKEFINYDITSKMEVKMMDYLFGLPVEEIDKNLFETEDIYKKINKISFPNTLKTTNSANLNRLKGMYNSNGSYSYLGSDDNPYLILCEIINLQNIKTITIREETKLFCPEHNQKFHLKSLIIPSQIIYVDPLSIPYFSDIEQIKVDDSNETLDSRDDCNAIIETSTNTFIAGTYRSTIPTSVTKLGDYSFFFGDFEAFDIPSNIKEIGEYTFGYCWHLKEIVIPNTVEKVGKGAFTYACFATRIVLSNKLKKIEDYTFGPDSLTIRNVHNLLGFDTTPRSRFNELVIPDSVEEIGKYSFWHGSLSSISFSKNLKRIGYAAFYNSILPEEGYCDLNFNDLLEEIDTGAFGLCKINHVFIPKNTKIINEAAFHQIDNKEILFDVDIDNQHFTSMGDSNILYDKESNILLNGNESEMIPSETIRIADYAFYKSNINSLIIPDNVVEIGVYCFYDCSNLTNVSIKGPVKRIEKYTFYNCSNLINFSTQEELEYIDDYAFYSAPLSNGFNFTPSIKYIGDYAFSGIECPSITLYNELVYLGSGAFSHSDVTDFSNLSSIDTLYDETFAISSIKNVDLGNISTIGRLCFIYCQDLKEFTISSNITSIDPEAFYYSGFECFIETFYISKEARGYSDSLVNLTANVYFEGSEEEWIEIFGSNNYNLTLHYNYNFE